ncbi:MAG TPA: class I SAM-dependent methyltransferase [Burkholderiaceae bacterium]|nr:class I SAM-dependent methyltransferase [Burkholderiaceae bacterium]
MPNHCTDVAIEAEFKQLVESAARPYLAAGRTPYYFARGKLGGDPVFAAMLRQGLIDDGTRLTDLGCGQGVLLALLHATAQSRAGTDWPPGWPPPPRHVTAYGVDVRRDAIEAAKMALGMAAHVDVGDIRDFELPPSDVVTILDVLHYIDFNAQRRVLERVFAALETGGRLLLRVGDAAAGWRFDLTLAGDWLITLLRGHWQRRFFCRTADQWLALLREIGFDASVQPMHQGTPFANVLLIAHKYR